MQRAAPRDQAAIVLAGDAIDNRGRCLEPNAGSGSFLQRPKSREIVPRRCPGAELSGVGDVESGGILLRAGEGCQRRYAHRGVPRERLTRRGCRDVNSKSLFGPILQLPWFLDRKEVCGYRPHRGLEGMYKGDGLLLLLK